MEIFLEGILVWVIENIVSGNFIDYGIVIGLFCIGSIGKLGGIVWFLELKLLVFVVDFLFGVEDDGRNIFYFIFYIVCFFGMDVLCIDVGKICENGRVDFCGVYKCLDKVEFGV